MEMNRLTESVMGPFKREPVEIRFSDICKIFYPLVETGRKTVQHRKFNSTAEVDQIIMQLFQYARDVDPEYCSRLFVTRQVKSKLDAPYNWHRVLSYIEDQDFPISKARSMGNMCRLPEIDLYDAKLKPNPLVLYSRTVAFILSLCYSMRNASLRVSNPPVHKLVKEFVDLHMEKYLGISPGDTKGRMLQIYHEKPLPFVLQDLGLLRTQADEQGRFLWLVFPEKSMQRELIAKRPRLELEGNSTKTQITATNPEEEVDEKLAVKIKTEEEKEEGMGRILDLTKKISEIKIQRTEAEEKLHKQNIVLDEFISENSRKFAEIQVLRQIALNVENLKKLRDLLNSVTDDALKITGSEEESALKIDDFFK